MTLTQEQRTFVEDLLARMTPEEKIGQMNQESPSIVGGFDVPFSELIEMLTDGRLPQAAMDVFAKLAPWMKTVTNAVHDCKPNPLKSEVPSSSSIFLRVISSFSESDLEKLRYLQPNTRGGHAGLIWTSKAPLL